MLSPKSSSWSGSTSSTKNSAPLSVISQNPASVPSSPQNRIDDPSNSTSTQLNSGSTCSVTDWLHHHNPMWAPLSPQNSNRSSSTCSKSTYSSTSSKSGSDSPSHVHSSRSSPSREWNTMSSPTTATSSSSWKLPRNSAPPVAVAYHSP